MSIARTPLVTAYTKAIQKLLKKSHNLVYKPGIDVGISASQLEEGSRDVGEIRASQNPENQQAHYAAIETAFRSIFSNLIVSNSESFWVNAVPNILGRPLLSLRNHHLTKFGAYLIFYQCFLILVCFHSPEFKNSV